MQTTSRTTSRIKGGIGTGTVTGKWEWRGGVWGVQQTLLSLLESGTSRCTRLGMIWMFRFVASSTGRQQWAQLWATARNCTFHVVADTTVWRRNWARFSISLAHSFLSLLDQLAVGLLPSSTCFQSACVAASSSSSSASFAFFLLLLTYLFMFFASFLHSLCLLLVYCVISFELSFYIFLSLIIFIYAAAARFLMLLLLLGGAWRRGAVRCVPNCCKKRQRQREREKINFKKWQLQTYDLLKETLLSTHTHTHTGTLSR